MNILAVSHMACIRVIKQAQVLIREGHQVFLMTQGFANPDMASFMPMVLFYNGEEQLRFKLKTMTGIDVIHVHNEPSHLGWIAKEMRKDLPVVFDAHDLDLVRYGEATDDELRSLLECDAVIVPSEGYWQAVGAVTANACAVVRSMTPVALDIGVFPLPRLPGIVYQGGLGLDNYRDYRNVAKGLTGMGIPFHIHPASMNILHEYTNTGAVCYPTLPYLWLMRNLSRYDWGFCGCAVDHPQWDNALPNKLFEYLNAGLPVIVHKADECARFVEKHGVGVVVDSIQEIPGVYNACHSLRKVVAEKRKEFHLDRDVNLILNVYSLARQRMAEMREAA